MKYHQMLNQGQIMLLHFKNVKLPANEGEPASGGHENYNIIFNVMLFSFKYSRVGEQ